LRIRVLLEIGFVLLSMVYPAHENFL